MIVFSSTQLLLSALLLLTSLLSVTHASPSALTHDKRGFVIPKVPEVPSVGTAGESGARGGEGAQVGDTINNGIQGVGNAIPGGGDSSSGSSGGGTNSQPLGCGHGLNCTSTSNSTNYTTPTITPTIGGAGMVMSRASIFAIIFAIAWTILLV
jgi:hypothetical protein